ncbi:hypothetical protein D3C80_1923930 [compost metagenome]
MQGQQLSLAVGGEAGLLAAPIGRVRVPLDEVALDEASERAAGVGLVDAQALGQLLVGGGAALEFDQQVSLERTQGQDAALLGEHAEFAYQLP